MTGMNSGRSRSTIRAGASSHPGARLVKPRGPSREFPLEEPAEGLGRPMESRLHRVRRDAENRGGFVPVELLDVPEKEHAPVVLGKPFDRPPDDRARLVTLEEGIGRRVPA